MPEKRQYLRQSDGGSLEVSGSKIKFCSNRKYYFY